MDPAFPEEVEECTANEPNTYSGGGLTSPAEQKWGLGGYGVWWPQQSMTQEFHQQMPTVQVVRMEEHSEGTGNWGKMQGQRSSSTRM